MVRSGVAKAGAMIKLPVRVCSKSKTVMSSQLRGFRSCAGTIPVSPYDLQKFEEMKKHLDDLSDEAKATLVDRVNWAIYRNTSVKKKQTNWYNQHHDAQTDDHVPDEAALADALAEGALHPNTIVLTTFALCGFANFSSIAILLGGLGTLAPSRRAEVAQLGLRAVAAAFMANIMSAAIASLFLSLV